MNTTRIVRCPNIQNPTAGDCRGRRRTAIQRAEGGIVPHCQGPLSLRTRGIAERISLDNGLGQAVNGLHQAPLRSSYFGVLQLEVFKLFVRYLSYGNNLALLHVPELLHVHNYLLPLRFSYLNHLTLGRYLPPPYRCVRRMRILGQVVRCVL
jgi:hypothetical protein